MKKVPTDYDRKIQLSDLQKNTLIYGLASAHINQGKGFYTCTYQGEKLLITK